MKRITLSIALLVSIASHGQKKSKKPPEVLDSTMKVVVTKVNNAEDFYEVQTREVGTGFGYFWECRCYSGAKLPPKEGDTLTLIRPVLIPKKEVTRRFIFN